MSLSVLALAGIVAASFLTRSSPAWDRSAALREAPSAMAALARDAGAIGGAHALIQDEEGEWMLLPELDSRLTTYHGLRYRVVIQEQERRRLAVLQWAPGGRVNAEDDPGLPRWARMGSIILSKPSGP